MIKKLWFKYKAYILYIIFGGITTVVNYIVYFAMTRLFGTNEVAANTIGWIASVIAAYLTNRKWVFESRATGFLNIFKEAVSFALARVATLLIEDLILFIFVDRLGLNDIVIKIAASVITIVLNFIFSKFIVFRKNKKNTEE